MEFFSLVYDETLAYATFLPKGLNIIKLMHAQKHDICCRERKKQLIRERLRHIVEVN
jgi:hypothetical protein